MQYSRLINSIFFQDQTIDILRLDLIHPLYGGNKYFKLKYNLQKAKSSGLSTILTFGGAHSNHIYATAAACKEFGLNSIGIISGEKNKIEQSSTLRFAINNGMQLHFISREHYKNKTEENFSGELKEQFGNFYLIPEGGSNYEGVKGCTEILAQELKNYEYVFCACGTSATFSGIKISANKNQNIIGISVLKGENKLMEDANKWLKLFNSDKISTLESGIINQSTIINEYHFGGYDKHSGELIDFKKEFENKYSIPLDYIYNSKLFFAVFDLIKNKRLNPHSKILVIHSGGLQGNEDFIKRYSVAE